MAWVVTRDLDLHDCAGLICDRNPAPFLGERVIRWEKQPQLPTGPEPFIGPVKERVMSCRGGSPCSGLR